MKTQVERLEKNRVSLEVEVSPEQVEQALNRAYRKVIRQVNIPGFRRGKAPRKVFELHFGRESLYREALEELIPQAYGEAVEEADLDPVAEPDIDVLEMENGKPLKFKAEVDVTPEIELGEYKGLALEKHVQEVEDTDVDEVLRGMQERNAELVVVEKPAAEQGDFVVIDFEGFLDGQPFQGGAANGYTLELGGEELIPGFAEQIVGMPSGEEKEIQVTFPEDAREDLAGKEATFKVTLHEIKQKQVPELDDEFARDVSEEDSLEELKDTIRGKLEEAALRQADGALRQAAVAKAAEGVEVELPASLLTNEVDHMVQELRRDLAMRGVRLEDYLEHVGQSMEEMRTELEPAAAERVKARLVLKTIARTEGIQPTEEEVQTEIDRQATANEAREADVRKAYEDATQREALSRAVALEKTIDFLVEHAEVTETKVSKEEDSAGSEDSAAGNEDSAGSDESDAASGGAPAERI